MRTILNTAAFAYNVVKSPWPKQLAFARGEGGGIAACRAMLHAHVAALRYEIAPIEYFYFDFASRTPADRAAWVGQTRMWHAQKKFVPRSLVPTFSDKVKFKEVFGDLMPDKGFVVAADMSQAALASSLGAFVGSEVFVKPADGQCGDGAFSLLVRDIETAAAQVSERAAGRRLIVEPRLRNHEALARFAPDSLNTVRIVTWIRGGAPEILFARARFGVGGLVDNLAAGGIAAPVKVEDGRIGGAGVSTGAPGGVWFEKHPVSGVRFKDAVIPMWDECRALALNAAARLPDAKAIGWDIAVTPGGPQLIEGNHNWCKTLWQLPVNRGQRPLLEELLLELGQADAG